MQTQHPENQKNLILAIVLSMGVLLGWQFFYAGPKLKEEQERQRILKEQQAKSAPTAPTATPGGVALPSTPAGSPSVAVAPGQPPAAALPGAAGRASTREDALKLNPRVAIDTPALSGSISLKGARVDDIVLKRYRETVDPKSPQIVLFAPYEGAESYFTEYGWLAPPGVQARLPDGETVWTAEGNATLTPGTPVTLAWNNGQGLTFRRTFAVDDNYMFTITDAVTNVGGSEVALSPYARLYRFGTPKTEGFGIQHEGLLGFDEALREFSYSSALEAGFKKTYEVKPTGLGGWLGITDKYWAAALIPPQGSTYTATYNGAKATKERKDLYYVDYTLAPTRVAAGGTASVEQRLFAGAKKVELIDGYDASLKIKQFSYLVDWGWFYFITKPLFQLMSWLYGLLGNFGLVILSVTLIVKAAFFPLASKAYESMAKMKKLQPEMERLRDRFKDDKAAQQKELMALYAKEKINPLAGCLPILLQIPVFFALYKVLFISLDMRHAPFYGWIKDLSAPDPTSFSNLFGLLPFAPLEPWLLGYTLGVWPLIMGATMWLQMQLNPQQPDPTQQMIFNWMPVIFTFMLGGFASGLVIYWAWNNVLSLAQQYYIMKKQGTDIPLMDNLRKTFGAVTGLVSRKPPETK
jgi:YidC/Oxa1 family membrane protein insertase